MASVRMTQRSWCHQSLVALFSASCLLACAAHDGDEELGDETSESASETPLAAVAPGPGSVLQFHNSPTRDGLYVDGAFSRSAAAKLRRDTRFNARVSGPTYAQPLYVDGGPGGKDLLIVATEQNQVSAFDGTTGAVVWQKTLGTPAKRANLPCGNIPTLGVTGTPVVDAASGTLVVAAMTLEGGQAKHKIFALSVTDGSTKTGFPVDVSARARAGTVAFDSRVQNQRGALIVLNGTVYVPYGGHYGDCGTYHGWVVGVPLANPTAVSAWATRAKAGGLWSPGGIASDGTSLFVATGNTMSPTGGLFSAPSTWGDGEAVIRLPPSLKFSQQPADYAAAMNWAALDRSDADIGGSGPLLLNVPRSIPASLGLALGKDGQSYLLNAQSLGGMGKFLSTKRVSSEAIITAPAAYTTPTGTFVAFKGNGSGCMGSQRKITALKITPGTTAVPPDVQTAWCAGPQGSGSPIVTSTGNGAETVVWYVAADGDNKLRGFNGETGAVVFAGGGASEQLTGVSRFQTPIVAKGRLFVAANDQVYAFTVDGAPTTDGGVPPTDAGVPDSSVPPTDAGSDAGINPACQGTYDSAGKEFMATYCTRCHSGAEPAAGVGLDTLAGIRASADAIANVAANPFGTNAMPPASTSPQPTWVHRYVLRTWMNSCK